MTVVVFCDEAVDGGLEIVDGSEDAALEATAREFGEEALDGIESRCGCRCEVEGPVGMPSKPCAHFVMFVSGILVDDGVDGLWLRHLCLDGGEEAGELLMALALDIVSDDGAVEHVEDGNSVVVPCRL